MNLEKPKSRAGFFLTLPVALVIITSAFISFLIWSVLSPNEQIRSIANGKELIPSLYTHDYPANESFKLELESLRKTGKLKANDELLIHRSILATSDYLKIPAGLLWCLLFQESRLNHLEGIHGDGAAHGLGQFSYYSFFEINNHLDRYKTDNLDLFIHILGRDVRPIAAKKQDLTSPSSYYFIPTAVTSSAAYLNNRYHHLERILKEQNIDYNNELLWIYAAMAYNKGTRSVLSLFNSARKAGGNVHVEHLLTDKNILFASLSNQTFFTKALRRIWPGNEAASYAKELRIHTQNLKACSISNTTHLHLHEDKQ